MNHIKIYNMKKAVGYPTALMYS